MADVLERAVAANYGSGRVRGARVLRPGGRFAVFDILRTGPGEIVYPMPWAGGPEISVETPEGYAREAAAAGLREAARRQRREEGIAFLEELRVAGPGRGMAEDRRRNILAALRAGTLAPVETIFVKPT